MKKKINKDWIIDKSKYPLEKIGCDGIMTILVDDFAPSMKVVHYKKYDFNLFYFRHGTICWQSINWEGDVNIYKVFRAIFKTIENHIKENKIKGHCGFELSGMKKLDVVIKYLLNKNGYNTNIKNDILLVDSI